MRGLQRQFFPRLTTDFGRVGRYPRRRTLLPRGSCADGSHGATTFPSPPRRQAIALALGRVARVSSIPDLFSVDVLGLRVEGRHPSSSAYTRSLWPVCGRPIGVETPPPGVRVMSSRRGGFLALRAGAELFSVTALSGGPGETPLPRPFTPILRDRCAVGPFRAECLPPPRRRE